MTISTAQHLKAKLENFAKRQGGEHMLSNAERQELENARKILADLADTAQPVAPALTIPLSWRRPLVRKAVDYTGQLKGVSRRCRIDEGFSILGVNWRDYPYIGFDSQGSMIGLAHTEAAILRMNPKYVFRRDVDKPNNHVKSYPVVVEAYPVVEMLEHEA